MSERIIATCKGHQGSWVVDVTINGQTKQLATIHKQFIRQGYDGLIHDRHDTSWANFATKTAKWEEALRREKMVVLTDDDLVGTDPESARLFKFERKGYIAVFTVDEILVDAKVGIYMRLLERVAEAFPKRKGSQ
jgi:hypothetical protein